MNSTPRRPWRTEARFLQVNGRRLFALDVMPTQPRTGTVLYLPPFAEEMNRLRSHVASMARALASEGLRCVLLDPFGTGESDGHITDADWDHWLQDTEAACQWLADQDGHPPTLWGARTGALLAAEVSRRPQLYPSPGRLLLWQPVLDGKLFLTQYLRLRIASQVVKDSERETTDQIRARLTAGEIVEVAGYPLTGRIADQLATRRLADLTPPEGWQVSWIEVAAKPEQPLGPASQKAVEAWRAKGVAVQAITAASPMVWQVHRREEAPELQQATLLAMGVAA